jgi:hypothetical protein
LIQAGVGSLRLAKTYGRERLEAACARALHIGARSYSSVNSILKNNLDRRIVHNAYRLELDGPSMRKIKASEATEPAVSPVATLAADSKPAKGVKEMTMPSSQPFVNRDMRACDYVRFCVEFRIRVGVALSAENPGS